jgi:hypothetical protein
LPDEDGTAPGFRGAGLFVFTFGGQPPHLAIAANLFHHCVPMKSIQFANAYLEDGAGAISRRWMT